MFILCLNDVVISWIVFIFNVIIIGKFVVNNNKFLVFVVLFCINEYRWWCVVCCFVMYVNWLIDNVFKFLSCLIDLLNNFDVFKIWLCVFNCVCEFWINVCKWKSYLFVFVKNFFCFFLGNFVIVVCNYLLNIFWKLVVFCLINCVFYFFILFKMVCFCFDCIVIIILFDFFLL